MILKPVAWSNMFGGAGAPESMAFDDESYDLDGEYSIRKIEFNSNSLVEGIRVTYN
ncbi:hypothetical protein RhiJN_17245 [Ceratobasidium sp. AG-Ba]|nr:hypothetical protein RhiJN_17245 [Ceratobasidium sp. AG-Ba]